MGDSIESGGGGVDASVGSGYITFIGRSCALKTEAECLDPWVPKKAGRMRSLVSRGLI